MNGYQPFSVERVILPDSTIALYYILDQMIKVLRGLKVNTDKMKENVQKTLGLIFSQRVMLALLEKGMAKEKAYALTQGKALKAWEEKADFKTLVLEDQDIRKNLTEAEIDSLFDYGYHLKNVAYILRRSGIME